MRFNWRRVGAVLLVVFVLSTLVIPVASAAPEATGPVIHYVQRGDTLYRIAARYGVSASSIAAANNIRNWNYIYVGQRLVIPYRYYYGPCGYYACPPAPPPPPPPPPPCGYYNPCPPPTSIIGPWHVQYFRSTDLSGGVAAETDNARLDFNWGWGPPIAGMPNQNWSGRWTTSPSLQAGTYRIQISTDDGARVFINGVNVIDAWVVQAVHTYTQDVYIPGGTTNFSVEYFQAQGVSELHFNMWKVG